jgi:hypothetical protein
MVSHTQKRTDSDIHADLLAGLADRAFLQSLEIAQFVADDAPTAGFRRKIREREKDAAQVIEYEDSDADPRT